MKILGSILIFFTLSISLFAQPLSADAEVTATLVQGLSITNVGGSSIDFGEIVVNNTNPQTPTVTPQAGANFEVIGGSNQDVTVTFSNVTLSNGNSTMTFTPSVEHTGTSSTYSSGTAVTSGNTYTLDDVSGSGYLYLWAGGSLAVAAGQEHGDYTGTFTVSVAY